MNLTTYILAAMLAWVPLKYQPEGTELAATRYASIAADVAEVVSDPNEDALFKNDEDRRQTALLVLSVAASESRYAERIDIGHCRPDECDGRRAFSMWQIHPDMGLMLDTPGWRYGADGFKGADLAADRRVAIRCFLHIIRGTHDHRYDSAQRREVAIEWAASHPVQ